MDVGGTENPADKVVRPYRPGVRQRILRIVVYFMALTFVGCCVAIHFYVTRSSPAAEPAERPADHPSVARVAAPQVVDAAPLPVRVVFVSSRRDHVTLDCVVGDEDGSDGEVPPGTPFAVEAALPMTAVWAAAATESVLREWAEEGTVVELALARGREGRNVVLSSADTRLQLPMAS